MASQPQVWVSGVPRHSPPKAVNAKHSPGWNAARPRSPTKAASNSGPGWVDEFSKLRAAVVAANEGEKAARMQYKTMEAALQQALSEKQALENALAANDDVMSAAIGAAQESAEAELARMAEAAVKEREASIKTTRAITRREEQEARAVAVAAAVEQATAAAAAKASVEASKVAAQEEERFKASMASACEHLAHEHMVAVASAVADAKAEVEAQAAAEREAAVAAAKEEAGAAASAALAMAEVAAKQGAAAAATELAEALASTRQEAEEAQASAERAYTLLKAPLKIPLQHRAAPLQQHPW